MARLKDGNLAQRTLCDAVNRHRLFAGDGIDRRQVTVRAVRRLGEDHLAPALRDADPVPDELVAHCAELLAHREPGHGNSSDLLPLYLAVRGRPMLPEYIKLGVLRCLDGMVKTLSEMHAKSNTASDVVIEMSTRRTRTAATAAVPGRKVSGRKRELTYQTVHDGFECEGLDKREEDGNRSVRAFGSTNEYTSDMLQVAHEGGRYNDPQLPAKAVSALTGWPGCPEEAFTSERPSLSEVTEWIRGHEWDNVLTALVWSHSNVLRSALYVMPGRPIPMTIGQVLVVSDIITNSGPRRRDDFQLTR